MQDDLKFHLRSLSRFIYFVTDEEDRFIQDLNATISKIPAANVQIYNTAFGMLPAKSLIESWKNRNHPEPSSDIHSTLIQLYKDNAQGSRQFYVITDPDTVLANAQVVRRLLNLVHQMNADDTQLKVIIFVGPYLAIPPKLQRYIEVVRDQGLTHDEIRTILEGIYGRLADSKEFKKNQRTVEPVSEELVQTFKGLTAFEVSAAADQSIIRSKGSDKGETSFKIDPSIIASYKRRQIKKTNLVTYIETDDFSFDRVGGAQRFKEWAKKTRASWTPEGRAFGLKPPKGVLLMGVWGCGKSISVKALGNAWGLPLIQLETGKLRQSAVGESEGNMYRVLNLIEAAAPCVVWVDEAEKSLSGGQSSSQSDSGITSRMIGILSTWMQETKLDVCFAMTANTAATLPPEFMRRMDERFFFDLPTEDEIVDILKIHLRNNRQDPTKYALGELAEFAKLMVGSEVEQAIQAAMIESFHQGKPQLDGEILADVLKSKPRIFKTLADEVRGLVEWIGYDAATDEGIRARFASNKRGQGFQEVYGRR